MMLTYLLLSTQSWRNQSIIFNINSLNFAPKQDQIVKSDCSQKRSLLLHFIYKSVIIYINLPKISSNFIYINSLFDTFDSRFDYSASISKTLNHAKHCFHFVIFLK